jgi:NDP-sugar pyrophosphorylase family protein
MQIVIPMAGTGKRFAAAGYTDLKPLIKVDGKPIIEYVVNLFPEENNVIFICNEEHLKTTNLKKTLQKLKPNAKIAAIKPHKLGPIETILRGKDYIADNEPIIINHCDFFQIWDYKKFKRKVKKEKIDGAIICYRGFHPHLLGGDLYAGVKTDKNNVFIETKEKFSYTPNKMDTWQSSGTYFFRSGAIAKKYLQEVVDKKLLTNNEYYIPWAYNLMKKDQLHSIVYPAEYFCQWGTPKDLEEYLYWSKHFLSKKNA